VRQQRPDAAGFWLRHVDIGGGRTITRID